VNEAAAPRRWPLAVVRLGFGAAIFGALLWLLLRGPEVMTLAFVPGWWAVGLVGSALANAVTAWRWRLLSESMTDTRLPYGVYFHHLAATRVLGQFLPSLLVDLVGRSASLRAAGSGASMGRLVAPLVLERVLDLALPVVLLPWALALERGAIAGAPALWLHAGVLVVFASLAIPLLGPMARLALRVRARLGREQTPFDAPPVPRVVARGIALSSVARWVAVTLQYWGAAAGLGLVLAPQVIAAAMPIGQLAALVGITPGALGIQDSGWASALWAFGVTPGQIAVFVVASRAAMIVNFAVLAAATWRYRVAAPSERASAAR
jgi:hypothetical protein